MQRRPLFQSALICAICGLFLSQVCASPREDLLFELNAALKTRDGAGFAHCFNFEGADNATRESFVRMIGAILAWPSFDVSTTERKDRGAPIFEERGHRFTLNGDWQYQIHVFLSKATKKGYVFPAGRCADGKDRILAPVPARVDP